MDYTEALNLTIDSITPTTKTERVDIDKALNRVLSKDIYTKRDLPPFNNSAMDGYAFKHSDINSNLKVVATILAGDVQEEILNSKECYKIMTGSKVPNDCDTIAPKEICSLNSGYINVTKSIKRGNALRLKGEEIKRDSLLLNKGTKLAADTIALLASQGIDKIECYKELNIAIVSTGSELKELNEEAKENELYNINGINLKMHLKSYGFNANYIGVLPDDLKVSSDMFKSLHRYDILITTGGVSLGDADFTKEALINSGFKELFHGAKVKPGHPILIGHIDKCLVVALPGNPLAAILQLIILAIPAILKMQGHREYNHQTKSIRIGKELTLKSNRANIVLGKVEENKFYPYRDNKYGSGMISPLVESDSLVVFKNGIDIVAINSEIEIIYLKK